MKTGLLALGRQRLERLVVLVDVQVFAQGNVNYSQAYAALIHSCIERALIACNEHNIRHKSSISWGYKFFDSSLSPSASNSTILKLLKDSSGGLKYIGGLKSAEENLGLFQRTLSRLAAEVGSRSSDPCQVTHGKVDFLVRALQELLSDFTWNSVFISDGSSSDEDQARSRRGERQASTSISIQQNLVMVFSHLPDNMEKFAGFMNMSTSSEIAKDIELMKAFSLKMKLLQKPFRLQGIRACWIDMPRVSTSVVNQGCGLSVSTETDQKPQRQLYKVLTQTKWKYMTMDALAIASECLPPALVWSSIAYPDLEVQPNALRMQAKLRITVQDRDGKRLQPDICKLEVVPLGSNVVGSALMKESVSELLRKGSLSSKAERLSAVNSSSLQPPIVKIVVKSLLLKQDVTFKCSLRYLLHYRVEHGAAFKTTKKTTSAEKKAQKLDLADDATSDVSEHDILQQLQLEPRSFEPGERAWQVLLIAIARKRSVAEIDLYVDGNCSSAILEPITVQYAALLQEDLSSNNLSSDSSKQVLVQNSRSKPIVTPPPLQTVVKSEGADLEGSECGRIKQEMRPSRRIASTIPVEKGPLLTREEMVGGFKQKLTGAEEINRIKREAYSWIQHWRHILRRKSIGTGTVQIENRYIRPRLGTKPSKAVQIIKCWLDQVSKPLPVAEQQLVPFTPATPGSVQPVIGEQSLAGGLNQLEASERVGLADNAVVPLKCKDQFSDLLDTEEQAERYLSSIEQMLQDCLQSDAGELQVFVKGVISNATRAQRILLKKRQTTDLVRPLATNKQCPIKDDDNEVQSNAQKNIGRQETAKPCNSESSCASSLSKAGKADLNDEVKLDIIREVVCSVSVVGNGGMPDSNCIDYGGPSDGADSVSKMVLVMDGVGTGNQHEATDESQPNSDEFVTLEMVAGQLMDKLLVKPKKLSKQYKDCDSVALDVAHIRKEKLRAYELQILFRMELIERDCDGPLEKEKTRILKEICRLLDDIQFDLGGGVFGSENLHDYSTRVIHNRYKERLPQTVADIFERMEFNGYVEGALELQAAPDSTHAPADLVRSLDQKETEGEELTDKRTTMEAATRPHVVPAVQPVEDEFQSGAISPLTKGRSVPKIKPRRKRSVPMDAFTMAGEKRKLASRLTHFGGPESLQRLKKIKIHHQSPKRPKVSNSVKEKYQVKEHTVVLETPRFERQNVRAEIPKIVHEEDEVESICTRVLTNAFGFGTPARVSKHMQPITRKRRLALFAQKKPLGRGLPRISRDVVKAAVESETLHRPAKPDSQLDMEFVAHNECARELSSIQFSKSFQGQRLTDPGLRSQPTADILKDARTAAFDYADLTGWILSEAEDQDSPQNNAESTRCTESETIVSAEQAHPLTRNAALETRIIQENCCHPVPVTGTQLGIHRQAVHDFNNSMLRNFSTPISTKRNWRTSVLSSKSKKPDYPEDCSKPQDPALATRILSSPVAGRDLFELGSAAEEPVQTVEIPGVAGNSQPVDLTSLENRWNDDEISCSLRTEAPVNFMSGYGSAQHTVAETQSVIATGVSERNGSGPDLAKRHGFLSASHSEELASRSLPKASLTSFSDLDSESDFLFETQLIEEVDSRKERFVSSGRVLCEDTLGLLPSDSPTNWEVPCMDLNGTQDFEQMDKVGSSQLIPTYDKSASPKSFTSYATSSFIINQTSNRVDPPSSGLPHRLAAKHDVPLAKAPGLMVEDSPMDRDFARILNEIFHSTQLIEEVDAGECRGRSLGDAGDCSDDYFLLFDENLSPLPRLKPEARLTARTPTEFQRKKVAFEEDTVVAISQGSPLKFSSPTLDRKSRRPPEVSPGQHPSTPNALVNCKRRPRSTTASPKETPKEKRNKVLRFI